MPFKSVILIMPMFLGMPLFEYIRVNFILTTHTHTHTHPDLVINLTIAKLEWFCGQHSVSCPFQSLCLATYPMRIHRSASAFFLHPTQAEL
jgi:hypothetical protein